MIEFYSETDFELTNSESISAWIAEVIQTEGRQLGEISIVFCDDAYLHALNLEFLKHDTLTDIISFDYSLGTEIHGEIYISVERVKENAELYLVDFLTELHRVIIHGILHYCGYKDKSKPQIALMRRKEEESLLRLRPN